MKKLLLALCATLSCSITSFAQDNTLDSVYSRGFNDVHSLERGMFYYTCFIDDKHAGANKAKLVVYYINEQMDREAKAEVEVSPGSEILNSSSNGMFFFFLLGDAKKKTLTYIVTDRSGRDVKKKVVERVQDSEFGKDVHSTGFIVMPENIIVLHTIDARNGSFELECTDKDFKPMWRKRFAPEKGSWELTYVNAVLDKIYIQYKERVVNFTRYRLQAMDVMSGDVIRISTYTDHQGVIAYLDNTHLGEGDMTISGGKYYMNNNTNSRAEGIVFCVADPTANMNHFHLQSYASLPDSFKQTDMGKAILSGDTRLMVEDVLMDRRRGFVVIAEAYREAAADEMKGATGSIKGVTLGDFVVLNYDDTLGLTSVATIEKTPKTAVVSGPLAAESIDAVASWLNKQKFFSYRGATVETEKPLMVYKSIDSNKIKSFIIPCSAQSAKEAISYEIKSPPEKKTDKLKAIPYWSFDSSLPETAENNMELQQDTRLAKPGFVLIYDYKEPHLFLGLRPLEVPKHK